MTDIGVAVGEVIVFEDPESDPYYRSEWGFIQQKQDKKKST